MKTVFMTLALIVCFVFAFIANSNAEDFPDPAHPPIGPSDLHVFDTTEGSGLATNLFTVSPGGDVVTFDFNLITNEVLPEDEEGGGNGSGFITWVNDYFAAVLLDPSDYETAIEFYYITDIDLNIIADNFDEIDPGNGTYGPHDSFFQYQTGVMQGSVVIPAEYESRNLALGFGVFDIGDQGVDTAVLIDNISGPVPNGDLSDGLFGPSGFINQDGGSPRYAGNVHLLPNSDIPGVDITGFDGNYLYISNGPEEMAPVVPEPLSSLLFVVGGITLGFRHLRKRRKNI